MLNILNERLIHVDLADGLRQATLPEVYAALMADAVVAFPALRPHQRHAWHAFLVQLGALAMQRAELEAGKPPMDADEWAGMIGELAPDDEPWHLVVADITKPAFMQPPARSADRLADYKSRVAAADALDVLITAKNHDLKASVASPAGTDDWIFALITLQTMAGFGGAGNYGISRMNGGVGNRPAFAMAPAGGVGAHVKRDLAALPGNHPATRGGHSLLWLLPWDGTASERLPPNQLAPLYIEVCRRIRLRASEDEALYAVRASSKAARIEGKDRKGRTDDPWTPRNPNRDGLPLTLSRGGFNYKRVTEYLFDWEKPDLLNATPEERRSDDTMQLVARAMVRGQGKTGGYYERVIPIWSDQARRGMTRRPGSDSAEDLGNLAQDRIREVGMAQGILRHAIATFLARGESGDIGPERRALANSWANRLDEIVDRTFFDDWQHEFDANDRVERQRRRNRWLMNDNGNGVVDHARKILQDAVDSLPCPAIHRYKAREAAEGLFEGRIRSGNGGLPFLFDAPPAAAGQGVNDNQPAPSESAATRQAPWRQRPFPNCQEKRDLTTPAISAAPDRQNRTRSWGDIAFRLAGRIAAMPAYDRGGFAGLRRMDPDRLDAAAFWRLMAGEELLGDPVMERKWGLILHGMALMTRTAGGNTVAGRWAHRGGMSVGRALFLGGESQRATAFYREARLNRLLTARDDTLRALLTRMFRMLAAAGVSFDWREMASFILNEGYDEDRAEAARRRIARDYYRTLRRNSQRSEE